MNAIGLKYVGKREEGISVMLYRSYKTVKVSKIQPYRFTNRDIVNSESINYYNRLANLGLVVITDEKDFQVGSKRKTVVRKEPLAAETDVQIDPTQKPETAEDKMVDDSSKNDPPAEDTTPDVDIPDSPEDEEDTSSTIPASNEEFPVDKEAIKTMSAEEISEYLEMNFSKDQLKSLINEMGLDISAGRKGVPTLVGEIVAAAELDSLISYLSK